VWQWGIDGREGYIRNTLAKSSPKFRSIEANSALVGRDSEANRNEFGVVGTTVGTLTEVFFKFLEMPLFDGGCRVCTQGIVNVEPEEAGAGV